MTTRADVLALVDEMIADVDQRIGTISVKAGGYNAIRKDYGQNIEEAMLDFFMAEDPVTAYRNAMNKSMSDAFLSAFELGYTDNGAELPLDDDALEWLSSKQEQEFGFIRELFVSLKDMRAAYRAKEIKTGEVKAEVVSRRDGYLATLDAVYTAAKMYAKKNAMLEWRYGDTVHCGTCEKLNGQKHKATWYLSRDYIPGKPGAAMDCGGWRCQCRLIDVKSGNEITIE